MIKISKPVLPNDFLLSSVQFTSLNSIFFKNVKNIYEGSEKIVLEYEHSSKIKPSSRDWIGLFPRGWNSLQQYVTFEWVSQSLPSGNSEQNKENADLIRRTINFCPKYHMGSVNSTTLYQFVYISKQIEVLGVSIYFRFDTTNITGIPLELECLVPISTKLHSSSVSDFGIFLGNNISSSTSLDTRTLKTSSIHSLQNLDLDNKNWTKTQLSVTTAEGKKPALYPRKAVGTGDSLDPYSSHSEPVFPMSFQLNHCKKCFNFKRGGEFLRSQQVLQSKVGPRSEETSEFGQMRTLGHEMSENKLKIVMERNKVLEERAQEMKKEMERLQTESKKLKMSFYNVNKEKVAYEKFVKDFIKSLEKDSIVRVVNGNSEILVKKVNYVGMEEHFRGKKTSKRERELKAVIGLQEITIRNLINSLQKKAKSVQELNQTVKLAQAFSSAEDDPREYNSDAETVDEISNSDVTSEYEFSLSKPPPPEDVIVEDADAVLDDIRRTTEMELKDIGINRSLGKSSSKDTMSESSIPNLSVCRFQNQNEGTRPKKPRLFENLEDCWPFSENAKTVQRKVLEENSEEAMNQKSEKNTVLNENQEPIESEAELIQSISMEENNKPTMSDDSTNFEDYYDAYEDSEESLNQKNTKQVENDESKKNFLVTAIIPQDMKMQPTDSEMKWLSVDETEKKIECLPDKVKKFTCEFSIDFGSQLLQKPIETPSQQTEVDSVKSEQIDYPTSNEFALIPSSEIKREKSLVTFKKSNKCVEIKITQVDQKKNSSKNFIQQNLIVKFAKDSQANTITPKSSKFEFNLALTGLGCMTKPPVLELSNVQREELELKPSDEVKTVDNTPRTIWNDASDVIAEEEIFISEPIEEDSFFVAEDPVEDKQSIASEHIKEESTDIVTNVKSCEDSLRYEKNLEYLQQKTDERVKEDEEIEKNKPSAILIQDGHTKLALIRY